MLAVELFTVAPEEMACMFRAGDIFLLMSIRIPIRPSINFYDVLPGIMTISVLSVTMTSQSMPGVGLISAIF